MTGTLRVIGLHTLVTHHQYNNTAVQAVSYKSNVLDSKDDTPTTVIQWEDLPPNPPDPLIDADPHKFISEEEKKNLASTANVSNAFEGMLDQHDDKSDILNHHKHPDQHARTHIKDEWTTTGVEKGTRYHSETLDPTSQPYPLSDVDNPDWTGAERRPKYDVNHDHNLMIHIKKYIDSIHTLWRPTKYGDMLKHVMFQNIEEDAKERLRCITDARKQVEYDNRQLMGHNDFWPIQIIHHAKNLLKNMSNFVSLVVDGGYTGHATYGLKSTYMHPEDIKHDLKDNGLREGAGSVGPNGELATEEGTRKGAPRDINYFDPDFYLDIAMDGRKNEEKIINDRIVTRKAQLKKEGKSEDDDVELFNHMQDLRALQHDIWNGATKQWSKAWFSGYSRDPKLLHMNKHSYEINVDGDVIEKGGFEEINKQSDSHSPNDINVIKPVAFETDAKGGSDAAGGTSDAGNAAIGEYKQEYEIPDNDKDGVQEASISNLDHLAQMIKEGGEALSKAADATADLRLAWKMTTAYKFAHKPVTSENASAEHIAQEKGYNPKFYNKSVTKDEITALRKKTQVALDKLQLINENTADFIAWVNGAQGIGAKFSNNVNVEIYAGNTEASVMPGSKTEIVL